MLNRKSILVTGGAGFLGSHLCDRLANDGHHVVCLDNFYTGQRENIEHLLEMSNFTCITHDVTEPVFEEVEEIFNLACPASPIHYQRNRIQTMKTSVLGAINMLELAKRQKCRIFQASTSEVYGDPLVHPQTESYWGNVNPIGPRGCYDEGKRCAETLFFDYQREYGIDIKVARLFNTYGPNMDADDGRVVSNFIIQALKGEPITIYGDGSQTRSFCYVDDLLEGIIRVMNTAEGVGGPFNLGNPVEFTVGELADLVIELTGSKSTITHMKLPPDDPCRRRPDITSTQARIDWQPKVPLRDGLEKTIAYFEGKLQGQSKAPVIAAQAPESASPVKHL